ncbi:MAG TPA: hypothetical protein VIR16_11890, partial [Candidatus Limnocylindrales bacterium]
YHVPGGDVGAGIVIVHRIVGGDGEAGYVLQGDNNPSPDPWRPRSADIAGTAWLYMPSIGRALALLHQPVVIGALAASLAVAWVFARPSKTPDCAPVLLGRRRRRRAIAVIVGD